MGPSLLIIEPFYGGSHKQLIDLLESEFGNELCEVYSLPAKKWHWRARTSSLYFAQSIPRKESLKCLFCSSTLNLAELVALRPDLAKLKKVIYFHENQLVYPVRKQKDRDFQYGYNQILSSLVADIVLFNSKFNMDSFLDGIRGHLKLIPDHRPKDVDAAIQPKCQVLFFPINFTNLSHFMEDDAGCISAESNDAQCNPSQITRTVCQSEEACANIETVDSGQGDLHIIWPHRWEHDKNPDLFFSVLFKLKDEGIPYKVSVLGEQYTDVPEIFAQAKERLAENIVHWGYAESKEEYFRILRSADVAISTADHEFFGVAMMESVYLGCFPICPNRLVYPELFPRNSLYNTDNQLFKKLKSMCKQPNTIRSTKLEMDMERFSWSVLRNTYRVLLSGNE